MSTTNQMSTAALLFILSASVSFAGAFLLYHGNARTVTKMLSVTNGDPWGVWHTAQFCAAGSYAVGYLMKIEQYQHSHDDTSLNAITLVCATLDGGKFGGEVSSGQGQWGTWTREMKCDPQEYLTSFALQVEPRVGSHDDTAANYVKFHCRPFSSRSQGYELVTPPGHGLFGKFGEWSESCDSNSAICGLSTRVEGHVSGDDTALNDVKLYCCND